MSATALIVFREILEIALILSVILAATKGVPYRNLIAWLGIFIGVIGSICIAFTTSAITQLADGMGQEIMHAAILITAAAVIGWTVLWMQTHGRQIAEQMKALGNKVTIGQLPVISISVVIALSVLREGAEIVLFSYGLLASGSSISSVIAGGLIGILLGSLVGTLLYLGLIRISPKHMFFYTSILLVFLAAGMMSQAVNYLAAVNLVPDIIYPLWDSSHILSEQGNIGQALHVLIGYTDRPSAMQVIVYAITAGALLCGFYISQRKKPMLKQN